MSEAGLKTQAVKNWVYVQTSARDGLIAYLKANPRSADAYVLCLYDIPDGRLPPPTEDDSSYYIFKNTDPSRPENDWINILGTPLGSPTFVEEYLDNKLKKHNVLL
jgi:hypothetical protein